jgi:hypothetical protein
VLMSLAVGVPVAIATIWKTGGVELKSGESFSVTVEKKVGYANFVLSTNGLSITCTQEVTIGGNSAKIEGGNPGESKGALEFKGCTAPAKCEVQGTAQQIPGRLGSTGFAASLREGEEAGGGFKLMNLVTLSGLFEFINEPGQVCPLTGGNPYRLTGEELAEINPLSTEATELKFIFQTAITRYKAIGAPNCIVAIVPLKLNNEQAKLTGEAGVFENVLPPRAFGAF